MVWKCPNIDKNGTQIKQEKDVPTGQNVLEVNIVATVQFAKWPLYGKYIKNLHVCKKVPDKYCTQYPAPYGQVVGVGKMYTILTYSKTFLPHTEQ